MIQEDQIQESILEKQLTAAIHDNLQNYMAQNASFLAERLLAERDSEKNRGLLAECYLQENKAYKAYYILKNCKSEANRYKFAVACLRCNSNGEGKDQNKLDQAKKALQIQIQGQGNQRPVIQVVNGAHGHYLLGVIYERRQKQQSANEHFLKAVELNPTMWQAYEKICKGGYQTNPVKLFSEQHYNQYENNLLKNTQFYRMKSVEQIMGQLKQDDQKQQQSINNLQIPGQNITGSIGVTSGFTSLINNSYIQNQRQQIPKNTSSPNTQQNQNNVQNIWNLLYKLALPLEQMHRYKCEEAIQSFKQLPKNQYNTGWVLTSIAKCYMEIVKYSEAEKYYQESQKIEPYRLEGMEYYSACLWQLKKQVELCCLAHSALEKTMYAFETWIIVGNCFSLNKEHGNALKFFTRALQLNQTNPYTHCLCGHEHVYNDDFKSAKKSFETALNYDMRHYNAWWGLGNICFKQERYKEALQHFDKSIELNQNNPVLFSYIAQTYSANGDYQTAMEYFNKSEAIDPKNGLNKFQKANALVKLEQHDKALKELEILYQQMPREAPIPTLMGQIYKKLGKTQEALKYFNIALDLETKDQQRIKTFIESLSQSNYNNDFEQEF